MDDVGRHQDLQTEQQGLAQADLELMVEIILPSMEDKANEVARQRRHDGEDDDGHRQHLDEDRGAFDPLEDGTYFSTGQEIV